MSTSTHAEHPIFIHSIERSAERRPSNWWTAVAIVGLAVALLAMVVQPSYPDAASSGGEVPVLAE